MAFRRRLYRLSRKRLSWLQLLSVQVTPSSAKEQVMLREGIVKLSTFTGSRGAGYLTASSLVVVAPADGFGSPRGTPDTSETNRRGPRIRENMKMTMPRRIAATIPRLTSTIITGNERRPRERRRGRQCHLRRRGGVGGEGPRELREWICTDEAVAEDAAAVVNGTAARHTARRLRNPAARCP